MEILLNYLYQLPPEGVMFANYVATIGVMWILFHFFKREGLYLFITLAIVLGNLEVLKMTDLQCFDKAVALGTVLFTCTYLATDILVENYGVESGKQAIGLAFGAVFMSTVLMTLTVGIRPSNCQTFSLQAHEALKFLFTPVPSILLASLASYGTTQYLDVKLFNFLKNRWQKKYLGLRALIATVTSTFLDNVLFSILAWKIFHPLPLGWMDLWQSYIWGAFILRMMTIILNIPVIYLFRRKYTYAVS